MTASSFIQLIRPAQWLKNLLLLFPPFFAGKMADKTVLELTPFALIAFSLTASSNYIINDIKDSKADRNHVTKKNRIIARGDIAVSSAISIAVLLFAGASFISFFVSRWFWSFLIIYLIVSLTYTFILKDIVIIDIFAIALGFLIRVLAGGEAFHITVTNWLFLTVFLVALFLAAGKRLGEMISLGDGALNHRKSLTHYSHSFLDGILWFSGSASLVTYALYTLEHGNKLFYTVPLAAFGLLRYVYIVKEGKGDPTESLLKDAQIMAVGILWAVMIGIIIYKG